jgi:hypothetical protein
MLVTTSPALCGWPYVISFFITHIKQGTCVQNIQTRDGLMEQVTDRSLLLPAQFANISFV